MASRDIAVNINLMDTASDSIPLDNTSHSFKTLRRHGRSFYFASFFLGRKTAGNAARLYRFCRKIDDMVDNSKTSADQSKLRSISGDLKRRQSSDEIVQNFLALAAEEGIEIEAGLYLIDGVLSDIDTVRLKTRDDLIQYCYKVAGTVGLMMCPVLECYEDKAKPHAIDLGIAMQLTNIARDVLEDAKADRRYLPASKVGSIPYEIVNAAEAVKTDVKDAVKDLLDLADSYYKSGRTGLIYLPLRAHLSILIASRVYSHIGEQIRARDYDIWQGRSIVPFYKKCLIALRCLSEFPVQRLKHKNISEHNTMLHLNIQGFPGANPPSSQNLDGTKHEA